jgi:hypothetical protein
MHPLVPATLLEMPGFDAFEADAQNQIHGVIRRSFPLL